MQDQRTQDLITHPLPELLRTHLLLLAQGWTHADDADGLRHDPILRLSVSDRRSQSPLRESDDGRPQGLASQPTLSRWIAQAATAPNRAVLEEAVLRSAASRGRLIDRRLRHPTLAVDMDALPMPVHGHQAGVEYNGYFHASGYHPLMLGSAQTGEFFGAVLRPGNVHAHHEAEAAVLQRLDWIQSHLARQVILRFDAASVSDRFLSRLEGRKNTSYVARIKKNARLETLARPLVERYQRQLALDPERLRQEGFRCHELRYQADSWPQPRRVVLVLLPSETEELPMARHFFLITDQSPPTRPSREVVEFYRQRGQFESMLGELSSTLRPQLSSTNRPKRHYRGRVPRQRTPSRDAFAANQAILTLNLLAYNLLHLGRQAAEQAERRPGRPKKHGRSTVAMSPGHLSPTVPAGPLPRHLARSIPSGSRSPKRSRPRGTGCGDSSPRSNLSTGSWHDARPGRFRVTGSESSVLHKRMRTTQRGAVVVEDHSVQKGNSIRDSTQSLCAIDPRHRKTRAPAVCMNNKG